MSANTRRAVAIDGAGIISVIEEPMRKPKPGQLLIEVKASMVSPGTELGGVKRRRESPTDGPPRAFGYSNAGVVIAQGEGCEDIEIGTRVACMGGGYAQHASHVCAPRNMAVPIPENVSFDHAASIHLVATGLNAFRRGEFQLGEFVGVVGLGLVGQFTCQLARLGGCHVIALDQLPMRLEKAKTCGLERGVNINEEDPVALAPVFSRGYGLDGGVIAFGGNGTPAFVTLTKMIKKAPDTHLMGRIVIVGGARIEHNFASALGNLDVRSAARTGPGYHDEDWEHGADYPGAFIQWTTRRNMEECLAFMDSGGLQVEPLITHRVSLDDAPDACEELILHPDRALGVVFLP